MTVNHSRKQQSSLLVDENIIQGHWQEADATLRQRKKQRLVSYASSL